MSSQPVNDLPRWQLLEIVHAIVEYASTEAWHLPVTVEHDAKLPLKDRSGARDRQIDVLVSAGTNLRICEVQDRSSEKIGQQFVDQTIGKRLAVGAGLATMVSTKGFTYGALKRIRADDSLDAVHFHHGDVSELPFRWDRPELNLSWNSASDNLAGNPVPLTYAAAVNPIADVVRYHVLYGVIESVGNCELEVVVTLLIAPPVSLGPSSMTPFLIGRWPKGSEPGEFRFGITTIDGNKKDAVTSDKSPMYRFICRRLDRTPGR